MPIPCEVVIPVDSTPSLFIMQPAVAETPDRLGDDGSLIEGLNSRQDGVCLLQEVFRTQVQQCSVHPTVRPVLQVASEGSTKPFDRR